MIGPAMRKPRTQGVSAMKDQKKVARRDVLRAIGVGAGGVAAATSGALVREAVADSETNDEKRKARYQANSPNVQAYYRVNRYPTK
jgi:hypothetical protein